MQSENILKSKQSLIGSKKSSLDNLQLQSKKEQIKFEQEEQQNTEFSVYFLIFVFAFTFIVIFAFHIFSQAPQDKFNTISFFRPMKFFFTNFYEETPQGAKILFLNSGDENLKHSYFALTIGVGKASDKEVMGLSQMLADQLINFQYVNYSQNSEIFLQTLKDNDGEIKYYVTDYTTNFFIKCHNKVFELIIELFFVLITDITYILKIKNMKNYFQQRFDSNQTNIDQFEANLDSTVISLLKIMHDPLAHVFENGLRSKTSENLITQLKTNFKELYQQYYRPNLVTISAISNLKDKQIFTLLKQQILKFKNTQYQFRPFFHNSLQYIIKPSYMSKLHLVNSHIKENLLFLNFQVPYVIDNNRSFIPMQLFQIFLNLNGEDSFLKRLDHSDLTYNHKFTLTHDDGSHCLLQLRFHLRDDAYNKIHKILILFFEFINYLKRDNIETHYQFLQNISYYNAFFGLDSQIYKFQDQPLNNTQHVQFMSQRLQTQPPHEIFRTLILGPFIKSSWSQFLNSFTLDNLSIVFLSEKIKTQNFRILESSDLTQNLDNNLLYDYNYRTSKKFQNEQKLQSMKIQKEKKQLKEQQLQYEQDTQNQLQQKKESQLNTFFQKTRKKFEEENDSIFKKLVDKYIAIRPLPEYQNRKFFIYTFKPTYRQIFHQVVDRSQNFFTNFLPFDQQQLMKYSMITACQVPQIIAEGKNRIRNVSKVIIKNREKRQKVTQNQQMQTMDTQKVLAIVNMDKFTLDQDTTPEFRQFVNFKKCLMREFNLDTKSIIPTNLIKNNFLRVYFKQYRNTFQSKQVLNIELLSSSMYEQIKQAIEKDNKQKNNNTWYATPKTGDIDKLNVLSAKIKTDLFCQYFVAYIFKNFVNEFVLGNSLDCEYYGTIVTLKLETFEQQGVIFSKKILQELKNFNSREKFDVATLNDLKYQYIAQLQKVPTEIEPMTEYVVDKYVDYMKFNVLFDENSHDIQLLIQEITIDDLLDIQQSIFQDLQVSLLYTGNVNAVNAVNESKHYLKYFFEESTNQLVNLVPRQTQLPLLIKPFEDRTKLYRVCIGNKIKKNVYKTMFMVGILSNKQYIALNLTVDYLTQYFTKSRYKLKNVDSFKVKIKDYYGQFGILIHVQGEKLKPHMFEYIIENLLDQFIHFVQKINNFDLKAKAESTYKRLIAISGTLKTVNEKILQLFRQSVLSMSEMTFQDSFKSFNKGFLINFIRDMFYNNQKRIIAEFYKSKLTNRIMQFKVDRNFMLNLKDFEIHTHQYPSCLPKLSTLLINKKRN